MGFAGTASRPAALEGFRRVWDVAMDNTVDLSGYKHYVSPETGERPEVFVTFLNLAAEPGGCVNGVLLPVDDDALAVLDRRERNYDRLEVTDRVVGGAAGTVWTYVGSAAGRARYETGRRAGRAVVSREYRDAALGAFAVLGDRALADFWRTTAEPTCPVVDLCRVDAG